MNPQALFHQDFALEIVIASVVFALVTGALLIAVVFRRAGSGRLPSSRTSYKVVEAVYASVVAAIAVFLVVQSLTTNGQLLATRPGVTVDATGFQWCWRFQYHGTDVTVSGQCLTNTDIPTIELPAGRVIRFDVTSTDVLHALWIPALRYKVTAFPDHVNSFEAKFPHPGTYPGRCAEFCGLFHNRMDFLVRVVPAGQFATWLATQHPVGSGSA